MIPVNLEVGKKALITTHNWFVAPDGKQYMATYGTIKSVKDSQQTLGVRTNARSTNWYVELGNMTIAGCQIFYANRTDHCELGEVESFEVKDGKVLKYWVPSRIYDADQEHSIV